MTNIYRAITIIALTTQIGSTNAILEQFFGSKNKEGANYDNKDSHIVVDDGDQEIGELIYHPANQGYESLGEDAENEYPVE